MHLKHYLLYDELLSGCYDNDCYSKYNFVDSIHSFKKYLLRTYYVLGTVFDLFHFQQALYYKARTYLEYSSLNSCCSTVFEMQECDWLLAVYFRRLGV